MASREIMSLSRRLAVLEKARLQSKQPNLGYSTVDGGALQVADDDNLLTMIVGQQYDGTNAPAVVTGPIPPTPAGVTGEATFGGAVVTWDGTWEGGVLVAPTDFSRIELHGSQSGPTFTPDVVGVVSSTLLGSSSSPRGARFEPNELAAGSWYFRLVARTLSGKYSSASVAVGPFWTSGPAPATSPVIKKVSGTTSTLVIETEGFAQGVELEYHVSTTDGYTADSTTLFTTTPAPIAVIDSLPDGTPLEIGTLYYIIVVAKNAAGAAAPTAQSQGVLNVDAIDAVFAAKIVAGFGIFGTVSVGQITIDKVTGITVNRLGGGYAMRIPSDGISPIEATMQIVTDYLNVQNNLFIAGAAQLNGDMSMGNGITNPGKKPGLTFQYPIIDTEIPVFDGVVYHYGMVDDVANSANWITPGQFLGNTYLRRFGKAAGAWGGDAATQAWMTHFVPYGGITHMGSYYYILGQDLDRSNTWYIYKINDSTFAKSDEYGIGTYLDGSLPHIASDGTSVYYTWVDSSKNLKTRGLNPATAWSVTTAITTLASGLGSRYDIGGSVMGSIDSIGSTRLWVAFRTGPTKILCYNPSTWAEDTTRGFNRASGKLQGLMYDYAALRMLDFDESGTMHKYGRYPTDKSIKGEQAWVDDNATGGAHETMPGPINTYTLPARAYLSTSVDVPPDYANTDPLNTDKANKTALYLSDDGGTTWRRDLYDGTESWAKSYDTLTGIGTATPKATNEFLSSTLATPGRLRSIATGGGTSRALVDINGSGYAHFLKTLQAGLQATGTFAGTGTANQKTFTVTFDVPFAAVPAVRANPVGVTDGAAVQVTVTGVTASAMTVVAYRNTGTGGFNIHWQAVMMTQ